MATVYCIDCDKQYCNVDREGMYKFCFTLTYLLLARLLRLFSVTRVVSFMLFFHLVYRRYVRQV